MSLEYQNDAYRQFCDLEFHGDVEDCAKFECRKRGRSLSKFGMPRAVMDFVGRPIYLPTLPRV